MTLLNGVTTVSWLRLDSSKDEVRNYSEAALEGVEN